MPLTAEQKAMRLTGIGASESPMLAGVSPHGNAIDVFLSKMGFERPETDAQALGNLLEDGIVRWYEQKMGVTCGPATTLRHPRYPWMVCTPDRWVNGRQKLAQVKLVGAWMSWHWDDGVPEHVEVQVQHEMEVADVEVVDVVALIGGTDPRVVQVERDREMGEMLVELTRDFWESYVLTKTQPPVDGSESANTMLRRMLRHEDPSILVADAEADAWARALILARSDERDSVARRKRAEQELQARIGNRTGMKGERWIATWKKTAAGTRSFLFNCDEERAAKKAKKGR